jgi:hypothetical protein
MLGSQSINDMRSQVNEFYFYNLFVKLFVKLKFFLAKYLKIDIIFIIWILKYHLKKFLTKII